MVVDRVSRCPHDALARHVFCRPRAAAIVLRRVLPSRVLEVLDLGSLELHWTRHVGAQIRRPRKLPLILPVVLVQPPARGSSTRLSDIIDIPAELGGVFGAPFEARLYVDDLSGSVLDDPYADAGHLALVEITRVLLHSYRNEEPLSEQRLASLAPLFDTVLVHFGSSELEELLTYVVDVFGPDSPLCSIISRTFGRMAREMYQTIAESMKAKGMAEGRVMAMVEALLRILDHRALRLSPVLRERVVKTSDESVLQRWFDRALAAETVEAVFDG